MSDRHGIWCQMRVEQGGQKMRTPDQHLQRRIRKMSRYFGSCPIFMTVKCKTFLFFFKSVVAASDSTGLSASPSDWPTGTSAVPMGFPQNYTSLCSSIASCPTCLHTTFNCVWCGHSCQYAKCKDGSLSSSSSTSSSSASKSVAVTTLDQCEVGDANSCRLLHRYEFCVHFLL